LGVIEKVLGAAIRPLPFEFDMKLLQEILSRGEAEIIVEEVTPLSTPNLE
jgi:hypothetical protein